MDVNLFKNFVLEECCNCGVFYYITCNLQKNLKETKKTFYCPNGHGQSYTKSTAQLLEEKVSRLETVVSDKNGYITTLETKVKKLEKKKKIKK